MKRAVLAFAVIILSGCAPTKELHGPSKILTPDEIIDAVHNHINAISTFQAEGSISVESPSFINSGSFKLWIRTPDSARVDVEGPFGIRVASAFFGKDHYIFYNSFKNEVNEGDVSRNDAPSFMNIRIRPDEVIGAFCGTRAFSPEDSSPDSFAIGEVSYALLFRHKGGMIRYGVDREALVVTSIEHIDSSGAVWSEEHFDFERQKDGTTVLQSIRLTHEASETSVSLSYESTRINGPVNDLKLHVPADARRVTKKE